MLAGISGPPRWSRGAQPQAFSGYDRVDGEGLIELIIAIIRVVGLGTGAANRAVLAKIIACRRPAEYAGASAQLIDQPARAKLPR